MPPAQSMRHIEYYNLFKTEQNKRAEEDENYVKLNIACVFSPPAEGNKDIIQIQEDLQQERLDNEKEPGQKKKALEEIIDDYNGQYGTNHSITSLIPTIRMCNSV